MIKPSAQVVIKERIFLVHSKLLRIVWQHEHHSEIHITHQADDAWHKLGEDLASITA